MTTILSDNAKYITQMRYFHEGEDWQKLSIRCGGEPAKVESGKQSIFADKFSEIIYNMEFLPGGRILRNLGRIRGSLFNCYVLPVSDSIEDIGQWLKDCLITWSEGGGAGSNISSLRPSRAPILGKGGRSSGPISFLSAGDSCAATIESGGQRRAAGMAMMLVSHPDILKFINSKNVDKILKYFNISVAIRENFIDAVESDSNWDLTFNRKTYDTVRAKDIWKNIMENMVKYAEPGLINWDNLRSNNSYYYAPIISTNPCGEIPLEAYGLCDLGSIVLTKFISNINTNWKRMEEVIRLGVRYLDNIIEINRYIMPQFDKSAHDSRRIGIGVMGFGDYLFSKKIRYGSRKAIQEAEKLFRFIRDISYDESIKLSKEKGAFPKFDSTPYCKADFIRTLPASTRIDIKKYGIRNVTLNGIAPTGTISLLPEVTPSVEPLMAKAIKTNDNVGERFYIHPILKQHLDANLDINDLPDWYVDSFDLKPSDHLDTQVAIQKFTDCAVSKTINMPKGTKAEELSALLLEYIHDLKGVTVYVDESKEDQPIKRINIKEALENINKANKASNSMEIDDVKCHNGKCDI